MNGRPADIGVELRGVTKRFGATRALDALNLRLEPALLHGVIGPDGAGKTTMLRIVAGLLHPQEGTVVFTAAGTPAAFEDIRPFIAYMPSRPSLYPDLSIREHMEFFRSLYRLPADVYERKAAELLDVTRLERFSERKVGELSGGMYKKVGLICALLQAPAVLLLDEPTNGVDPISRREFWELLYGLANERILIVVSTAYMDEAERCGRVHLLDAGRVLRSGEPRQIMIEEGVKSFDEIFLRSADHG